MGSIWIHEIQQTFVIGHAQAGTNPELRTLLYRLARLLAVSASVVFVFDGPGRPAFKRGRNVVPADHWLVTDFKDMATAFGFDVHQVSSCS